MSQPCGYLKIMDAPWSIRIEYSQWPLYETRLLRSICGLIYYPFFSSEALYLWIQSLLMIFRYFFFKSHKT